MLAKLLILGLTATVSLGALIGGCKTPKVKSNFDLEKFAGEWFEIESTNALGNAARKCSSYKVEFKSKNKASLLHKFYSKVLNKQKTEYSDVTSQKSEPAKLSVTPLKSSSPLDTKWTLSIVDTDYDSYAVAYSCHKKLVSSSGNVHIFARTKTIDDKERMDLYDIVKKYDLPTKSLIEVPQEDKDCSD